jgi:hypothetical protein
MMRIVWTVETLAMANKSGHYHDVAQLENAGSSEDWEACADCQDKISTSFEA